MALCMDGKQPPHTALPSLSSFQLLAQDSYKSELTKDQEPKQTVVLCYVELNGFVWDEASSVYDLIGLELHGDICKAG